MAGIIIRNLEPEIASAIEALANNAGVSREEWLRRNLSRLAAVPNIVNHRAPFVNEPALKAVAERHGAETALSMAAHEAGVVALWVASERDANNIARQAHLIYNVAYMALMNLGYEIAPRRADEIFHAAFGAAGIAVINERKRAMRS